MAEASGVPEASKLSGPLLALYARLGAWRKQAASVYTGCQTQLLEWPSLTVEWLPDRRDTRFHDFALHSVAVGTQALPGSLNYVATIESAVPVDMEDLADFLSGEDGVAVAGGAAFADVKGHTRVTQMIPVDGVVHKIRAMPKWSHILAVTTSSSGMIDIHHTLSRPSFSADPSDSTPNLRLKGLKQPGFGLEWSFPEPGMIVAGSDDGTIAYWDIAGPMEAFDDEDDRAAAGGSVRFSDCVPPVAKFVGHTDVVHDVACHRLHPNILASACQDGTVSVWDSRVVTAATYNMRNAHAGGAFGVSFHYTAAHSLASCGADGAVSLWDIRRPEAPTHELMFHTAGVAGVAWAPFSDSALMSYGLDGNVVLWDLNRSGLPSTNPDASAPSELAFLHAGHLSRVTEARWCPNLDDEWLVASCDASNMLQLFRPSADAIEEHVEAEAFDVDVDD